MCVQWSLNIVIHASYATLQLACECRCMRRWACIHQSTRCEVPLDQISLWAMLARGESHSLLFHQPNNLGYVWPHIFVLGRWWVLLSLSFTSLSPVASPQGSRPTSTPLIWSFRPYWPPSWTHSSQWWHLWGWLWGQHLPVYCLSFRLLWPIIGSSWDTASLPKR